MDDDSGQCAGAATGRRALPAGRSHGVAGCHQYRRAGRRRVHADRGRYPFDGRRPGHRQDARHQRHHHHRPQQRHGAALQDRYDGPVGHKGVARQDWRDNPRQ